MRPEFARPWVRFPAGLRCVFSSDPAVSSSIFVGVEREENLIRNDPEKREFTNIDPLLMVLIREYSKDLTEDEPPPSRIINCSRKRSVSWHMTGVKRAHNL